MLALVVVLVAAGCAGGPEGDRASADPGSAAGAGRQRPVVEVPPRESGRPLLDPAAEPSTALGRLRAQYLPVWTSDFDWAFPPEVCGTAWELDGIAEPTSTGHIAVLGDFAAAAALTVMRYEHQLSRALADPTPLAQLCVATASVDPARSEALDLLASHLRDGSHGPDPAPHPEEVVVVGVSESSAVAVACTAAADREPAPAPARPQAYLLSVSRGLEDRVVDISYRVSDTAHGSADACAGLDAWTAEWHAHVQDWIDEGRLWQQLGLTITADGICDSPPPEGPDECPLDWPP